MDCGEEKAVVDILGNSFPVGHCLSHLVNTLLYLFKILLGDGRRTASQGLQKLLEIAIRLGWTGSLEENFKRSLDRGPLAPDI